MTNDQKPMPLENLPGSLRENNIDVGLVDMGQIVAPKRPYIMWLAAFVTATVLGVGTVATYNVMSDQELTVVVDVDQGVDPSLAMSKIVSESEGQILAVKQTEGNTYEIKVAPRKSKHSFLEWLRKNQGVKKAVLAE